MWGVQRSTVRWPCCRFFAFLNFHLATELPVMWCWCRGAFSSVPWRSKSKYQEVPTYDLLQETKRKGNITFKIPALACVNMDAAYKIAHWSSHSVVFLLGLDISCVLQSILKRHSTGASFHCNFSRVHLFLGFFFFWTHVHKFWSDYFQHWFCIFQSYLTFRIIKCHTISKWNKVPEIEVLNLVTPKRNY